MSTETDRLEKYETVKSDRSSHLKKILDYDNKKRIVVAGPGTGKTFLFRRILVDKTNALTLTFVNSLVDELSLELNGLSEVKTLHSYARSILSSITKKD